MIPDILPLIERINPKFIFLSLFAKQSVDKGKIGSKIRLPSQDGCSLKIRVKQIVWALKLLEYLFKLF